MRTIIFTLITLLPIGWALKDAPTEAELMTAVPSYALPIPDPTTTTSTSTTSTTIRPPVVVETAPTTTAPSDARCPQWWSTAAQMGWSDDLLPTLDRVIWNESRCTPDATNGADHGLVQVNWATWAPLAHSLGYTKQDLYVPAVNLLIGRVIYEAAVTSGYRCPWSPWNSSGNYCK